jgi:ATP-binding cassette subfamily B (MDR/TAP) protein 1
MLRVAENQMFRTGVVTGLLYGVSQFLLFIVFAIIFFLGTIYIRDNPGLQIIDVFTAIYAIFFAAMTIGNNSHFMPDIIDAKVAAANLFEIIDD